jgi:hypothetical protein
MMTENQAIVLECLFTDKYFPFLSQTLVVVARIFGGVKLGVGGLISAYKTTTQKVVKS